MIRLMRIIKLRNGRVTEAIKWSKEIIEYVNTNFPGKKVQSFISRFGDMNTMYWTGDFENIPDLDNWQQKLDSDKQFQDFIQKSIELSLFVDGTQVDTVMQTLP